SLRIIGRADDQIVLSTGYKVSPGEVTRHLENDPWIESLVIVGQDRPSIGDLVYPVLNNLPENIFSDHKVRTIAGMDAIEFERLCVERWRAVLKDFPRWMQIRRVGIMPRPLSVTSGGLNFKGGLRRRFVEQQLYANLVAQLYA
ncbi:MAG: hypothetical protein IT423_11825, partial [Pirellulaceae bacterium]|nr:hypothetical protein [Pirellulaceae bacterium]